MNEHFLEVKDKHKGETAILMAPGDSLNEFTDDFPKEYIRIAVNGCIIHPHIRENLDYYVWAGDIDIPKHHVLSEKPIREAIPKLPKRCKNYVCCWTNNSIIHPSFKVQTQIDPEDAKKLEGDWKFFNQKTNIMMTKNISVGGLNPNSVIFQALNILLYMGIKKIILVGVDGGGGHSYKNLVKGDICDWEKKNGSDSLYRMWKQCLEWTGENYPDVEILIKNPKFIKGIFKEI